MKIVIQGAMDAETDVLTEHFKPATIKTVAGFNYSVAEYGDNIIILSKTGVGIINASVSTAIAINEFRPTLIINQGCAGGHTPQMKIGDIVIGKTTVYINNFYTRSKKLGEGSNSLCWYPCKRSYAVPSTEKYIKLARGIAYDGKKTVGTLGSGDIFSKEVDRINYMHGLFGELCEDMESVAAMKTCEMFDVDRLALRIISNNELTEPDKPFDYETCRKLQRFVIALVGKITDCNTDF